MKKHLAMTLAIILMSVTACAGTSKGTEQTAEPAIGTEQAAEPAIGTEQAAEPAIETEQTAETTAETDLTEEINRKVTDYLVDIREALQKLNTKLFDNDKLDMSVEMEAMTIAFKRDGLLDDPDTTMDLKL